MISYETMVGKVTFSESYLCKLIGHEVTSCFGVAGMLPSGKKQRLFQLVGRKEKLETGIRISGDADHITVELHITVVYGMNINAIAASITEKVKYAVKEHTNITVDRVIVKIDGIKE